MLESIRPLIRTGATPLVAALLLWAPVAPVNAQVVVYDTFESWLAAVSSPANDNFSDLTPDVQLFGPLDRGAVVSPYAYSAEAPNGFLPLSATGGTWLSTDLSDDPITFNAFSANTRAFGGYFLGTEREGDPMTASLMFSWITADGSGSMMLPAAGTASFFGFTATGALISVTFSAAAVGDDPVWSTVSDVYLAGRSRHGPPVEVPEPSSLLLVSSGVVLLGVATRRRRRTPIACAPRAAASRVKKNSPAALA